MAAIRTIFFDFGRVLALFDHDRTVTRLLPHADVSQEQLYQALYESDRFDALERGALESADYIRLVRSNAPMRCTDDYFRDVFGDIFDPIKETCALVPHLAQRYRLVLASNTNEIHAAKFLKSYSNTFDHFSELVLSHEAKARKPEAEFYEYCQHYALCDPQECLFIDDREDNVQSAVQHGWYAIQFQGYDGLVRELSRHGVVVTP
jgi:putative hydrolase of the HAD superfamily